MAHIVFKFWLSTVVAQDIIRFRKPGNFAELPVLPIGDAGSYDLHILLPTPAIEACPLAIPLPMDDTPSPSLRLGGHKSGEDH
jgi:hypothetical protein